MGNYAATIGIFTALLTSIYSWRLFFKTFHGSYNNKKIPIIIDIDYRPYNWESDEVKSEVYKKALAKIDIIIGNDLEFNIADNPDTGLELANQLIKNKPSIIIYKNKG